MIGARSRTAARLPGAARCAFSHFRNIKALLAAVAGAQRRGAARESGAPAARAPRPVLRAVPWRRLLCAGTAVGGAARIHAGGVKNAAKTVNQLPTVKNEKGQTQLCACVTPNRGSAPRGTHARPRAQILDPIDRCSSMSSRYISSRTAGQEEHRGRQNSHQLMTAHPTE